MPLVKIYVHLIWSTKKRTRIITPDLKPALLKHIKDYSYTKEIFIDRINCVEDYMHVLLSLGSEQTISKVAMLLKGESSFWVNKNKLIKGKFEWQDEYMALSVNYRSIDRVRTYIDNQEEHHRKRTFKEEYQEFLEEYGLESLVSAKADLQG